MQVETIMTTQDVMNLLDRIAAESATTTKQSLLASAKADHTLQRVLRAALNPLRTYGIANIGEFSINAGPGGPFLDQTWTLLAALAERTLTGGAAKKAIQAELDELDWHSGMLLLRIITKDLRCGVGTTLVGKVLPGLLPSFEPMLAAKYEEKHAKFPCYVQPKLDGYRALAFVPVEGPVTFYSREGREITQVPHLAQKLRELSDFDEPMVFDGELLTSSFADTASKLKKQNSVATDARYCVFDVVTVAQFEGEVPSLPYEIRRQVLRSHLTCADPVNPADVLGFLADYRVENTSEISGFYANFQSGGLEGAIVKSAFGLYEGKRSRAWMKLKSEESEDLRVTGAFEGTGKFAGSLGGLYVDYKGVQVAVGSGITDKLRAELWALWLSEPDQVIGRIAEVAYHEVTPDGSLRHPRFKRFRDVIEKGIKT